MVKDFKKESNFIPRHPVQYILINILFFYANAHFFLVLGNIQRTLNKMVDDPKTETVGQTKKRQDKKSFCFLLFTTSETSSTINYL